MESLENAYQAQSQKVKDLTINTRSYIDAISTYGDHIQALKNLVQAFNERTEATKAKISEVSSEIEKMQSKLSGGNLTAEAGASLSLAILDKIFSLEELKKLYDDLVVAAQKAN